MYEEDVEISIWDYLHVIRKRIVLIVFVCFIIVVGTVTFLYYRPATYKATTRILIEKHLSDIAPFTKILPPDTIDTEGFLNQCSILKSQVLAKRVLQRLDLLSPVSPMKMPNRSIRMIIMNALKKLDVLQPSPSAINDIPSTDQQIIQEFLNRITITSIRGSRIVEVSVTSSDPEQSARLANTLVNEYIKYDIEIKLSSSTKAIRWLEVQLEEARRKLADSEIAVHQYQEENAIISLQDQQNIVLQKLLDLSSALNKAEIARATIETEYTRLKTYNHDRLESLSQVIDNPLIQQLKVTLLGLETELSELQKRFRAKHPSVTEVQAQIASVRQQIDTEIQRRISSIKNNYDIALVQEQKLTTMLENQKKKALKLEQQMIRYEELQREVESNRQMSTRLLQSLKETSLVQQSHASNIHIVDPATIPEKPEGLDKERTVMLALLIGLISGGTLAFFLESIKRNLETPADFKQRLDIPCLGMIPKVSARHLLPHEPRPARDVAVATVMVLESDSVTAECYRNLRTMLGCALYEQGSVVLITSSDPLEGKSTVVSNLGLALAMKGRKTLIIGADLRNPTIQRIFPVNRNDSRIGLVDLLRQADIKHVHAAIHHTALPCLDILPCGEIPSNPSELLDSPLCSQILASLESEYEHILIDSPPVNVVTDSLILGRLAHGIILVTRADKTTCESVQCALDQLREVGATILGGVLNNINMKKNSYYPGYSYPRKYQRPKEKKLHPD